jgi:hypothetical protein
MAIFVGSTREVAWLKCPLCANGGHQTAHSLNRSALLAYRELIHEAEGVRLIQFEKLPAI